MKKVSKNIRYLALLLCCMLISSISWASSGSGLIYTFVTSITASMESTMSYIACCNKTTCRKWTKTCKKCNKYKACTYEDDVTVPAAPTGLTASATSSTSINLVWAAITGATSYIIYSGTSSTALSQIGTSTTTTFEQKDLKQNTKYFYSVAAKNATGTSVKSSTVNATTLITTAILTRNAAASLNNCNDLLIEAYLPNGKFAGAFSVSDMSSVTTQGLAGKLNLKAGIYQILIKDRSSGNTIETKSITLIGK